MNYGFWLLLGQSAQTSIMAGQMRQLGHIGGELELQRLSQQYQATLAQVLFETEQATRYISALALRDGFAAGILARLKLNALQEIHPGLFDRYETKRAWAAATEQLHHIWSVVDTHQQWSPFGRNVVRAVDTLRGWQAFVGDPQASLAAVTATAEKARKSAKITLIGAPVSLLLGIVIGVVAHAPGFTKFTVVCVFFPMLFVGLFSKLGKSMKAAKELKQFQQQLASFNAFLADPLGGQLLDQVATRHPALKG
jgi:hypothetical protein